MRLAVIIAICLGLAACNTMDGMGQDIEKGGQAMSGAAERNS